ncbi:MAG: regulatory protein RecX [Alistipes sp.]
MLPKIKRDKTPEEATATLMRLCARAEKSSGDARRLMRGWGVADTAAEAVLQTLLSQKFIDDSRYAAAFVREKVNLSGWGIYKIRTTLLHKGIAPTLVEEALAELDHNKMAERLSKQLERKSKTIKPTTAYELKTKLIRYGLSLGYPYEGVMDAVNELVKNAPECNDFF